MEGNKREGGDGKKEMMEIFLVGHMSEVLCATCITIMKRAQQVVQ